MFFGRQCHRDAQQGKVAKVLDDWAIASRHREWICPKAFEMPAFRATPRLLFETVSLGCFPRRIDPRRCCVNRAASKKVGHAAVPLLLLPPLRRAPLLAPASLPPLATPRFGLSPPASAPVDPAQELFGRARPFQRRLGLEEEAPQLCALGFGCHVGPHSEHPRWRPSRSKVSLDTAVQLALQLAAGGCRPPGP